ncbi:MAG: hypothetical protein JF626_13645, partial [Polaromonas sp.]|nr:hypothetical protein [Polaromonas sp.]
MLPSSFHRLCGLAASLSVVTAWVAAPAFAQADAADSRITLVKVYAGSATVERVARVAAG